MSEAIQSGRCLCGSVSFQIHGPVRDITACHCAQCRRTSGHFAAMASAPSKSLVMLSSESLRWYKSSTFAERGFCVTCGSNIFWRKLDADQISITAGTLDSPTGLKIAKHIFVADKGDYYTIDPGSPQLAQG
jgi:hypothetical protein